MVIGFLIVLIHVIHFTNPRHRFYLLNKGIIAPVETNRSHDVVSELIGHDVVSEVQQFFVSKTFPRKWNETHIRLIPKVSSPWKVYELPPYTLCNVFYKIVAKIITKRLQPILNSPISENQSAFIMGRTIFDNVLIIHEILHFLWLSKAK